MFSFFKSNEENGEKGNKKTWLILIGAVLGVILIFFGSNVEKAENDTVQKVYSPDEDELILYQKYLEERVKSICESVHGVQNVTAIVTLAGGFESVYATEERDGNEEYVIIGSGSGAGALFLSRNAPAIAGIGIVCHGGDDAAVRQELTALISAAFHVSTNRIYVTSAEK